MLSRLLLLRGKKLLLSLSNHAWFSFTLTIVHGLQHFCLDVLGRVKNLWFGRAPKK
jgi:hypothetical protein